MTFFVEIMILLYYILISRYIIFIILAFCTKTHFYFTKHEGSYMDELHPTDFTKK